MPLTVLNWNVGHSFAESWYFKPDQIMNKLRGRHVHNNNLQDEDIPLVARVLLEEEPEVAMLHELDNPEQVDILLEHLNGEYEGHPSDVCNSRYSAALHRREAVFDFESFYTHADITLPFVGRVHHPGMADKACVVLSEPRSGFVIASIKLSAGPGFFQLRRNEMRDIISHIDSHHPGRPALIIGDLNMARVVSNPILPKGMFVYFWEDPALYKMLQRQGFEDAARSLQATDSKGKFVLDYAFTRGVDGRLDVLPGLPETSMDHVPIAYRPVKFTLT